MLLSTCRFPAHLNGLSYTFCVQHSGQSEVSVFVKVIVSLMPADVWLPYYNLLSNLYSHNLVVNNLRSETKGSQFESGC